MADDIAALKSDVQALKRDTDMLRATQVEHTTQTLGKVQQLSEALAAFNSSARSTDADFGTQMERMVHDVQELRGAVEVNEHRLGETETKIEASIAQRLEALTKQNAASQSEVSAATQKLPADKKEALAFALKLYKDGKANDARAAWRAIIKAAGRTSGVTDEAIVRLGDSYMDDRRYAAALREYVQVVEKFSQGRLIDTAFYKLGLCSLELGRLDDAQTFLGEVIQNYRKSPWLRQAKSRLDDVNRRLDKDKRKAKQAAAPAKASPAK